MRWQHPVRGLVPPLAFIPLAEETGLIVPLGRWVLETACRQATAWRDARGPDGPRLLMSVNLSARQFGQPDLVDAGRRDPGRDRARPGALELEITESVVMDQSEAGIRTLGRLRDIGVRLVLDDFGTGYSSLSYLKHLPLDTIKIDRTFVAGLDGDADRSIVDAVIAPGPRPADRRRRRGHRDRGPVRALRAMGCDVGQGYLFAKPLPAADATPAAATEPIARGDPRGDPGEPEGRSRSRRGRSSDRGARVRALDRSVDRRAGDGRRSEVPRRAARDEGQRPPKSRSMNRNRLMKSR